MDFAKVLKAPSSDMRDIVQMFQDHKIIAFDKARNDMENALQFYTTLESLSDMTVHSTGKYQGASKLIDAKIIVFSNQLPPVSCLPDRIVCFMLVNDIASATLTWEALKDELLLDITVE